MPLPKPAIKLIGAIIFIALGALTIHFFAAEASPLALTKTYSNPAYGFMLKMPADFSAYPPNATPNRDETGAPTGQAIFLQHHKGDSLQIVVAQSGEASPDNTFTAADLEREMPDVDPSEAHSVQLASGVTGITYTQGPRTRRLLAPRRRNDQLGYGEDKRPFRLRARRIACTHVHELFSSGWKDRTSIFFC